MQSNPGPASPEVWEIGGDGWGPSLTRCVEVSSPIHSTGPKWGLGPLLGVGEDLLIGQGASTFRPHMSLALSTSFAWALAPISFQQVHPSQHRSRELVEVTL